MSLSHQKIHFLSHWGTTMIMARLSSSFSCQYTCTLLIEMSSATTRTHLTDAHQMHAIHPNSESDYTAPIIMLHANPPCSNGAHALSSLVLSINGYGDVAKWKKQIFMHPDDWLNVL
jgi:hypothetical protein